VDKAISWLKKYGFLSVDFAIALLAFLIVALSLMGISTQPAYLFGYRTGYVPNPAGLMIYLGGALLGIQLTEIHYKYWRKND